MSEEPTIDLSFTRKFPDACCAEVARKGESQPCDKPAYAVTYDFDGNAWPVCIHHARTRRHLVPLGVLLTAAPE